MDNRIIEVIRFFNADTSFDNVESINEWQLGQLKSAIDQFGADAIKSAFSKAEKSSFLSGRKTPDWKACFGWLIKPENIQNILKGKYDDYESKRISLDPECYESSLPDDDDDEIIKAALAHAFDGMF